MSARGSRSSSARTTGCGGARSAQASRGLLRKGDRDPVSVYRFISAEKARTPVSVCCELLGVGRSGFYDWRRRAPSNRALSDAWLLERIKAIHAANRGVYGALEFPRFGGLRG